MLNQPPEILVRSIPWLLLGGGLASLAGAGACLLGTRRFLRRALPAPGKVAELLCEHSRHLSRGPCVVYRPVVTFSLPSGEEVRFKSTVAGYPPPLRHGQAVTVLYDPDRPQDARIRSFQDLWLGPLILGGLGLVFTSAGAVLLFGGVPA